MSSSTFTFAPSCTVPYKRYLDEDYDAEEEAAITMVKLQTSTINMPLTPPTTPLASYAPLASSYFDAPRSSDAEGSAGGDRKRRRVDESPSTSNTPSKRARGPLRRSRRLNPLTIRIRIPTHMRTSLAAARAPTSTVECISPVSETSAMAKKQYVSGLPYRRPTSSLIYHPVETMAEDGIYVDEKILLRIRVPESMRSKQ